MLLQNGCLTHPSQLICAAERKSKCITNDYTTHKVLYFLGTNLATYTKLAMVHSVCVYVTSVILPSSLCNAINVVCEEG